jgi:hypothetical protein
LTDDLISMVGWGVIIHGIYRNEEKKTFHMFNAFLELSILRCVCANLYSQTRTNIEIKLSTLIFSLYLPFYYFKQYITCICLKARS